MDGAGALTLKGDGSAFIASAEGDALEYLKNLPGPDAVNANNQEWAAWVGKGTAYRIGATTAKALGA